MHTLGRQRPQHLEHIAMADIPVRTALGWWRGWLGRGRLLVVVERVVNLEVSEHLVQGLAVGIDFGDQSVQLGGVSLGQAGQWVQGDEQLVGLGIGDIEQEDRHQLVRGGLGTEVAVDQLEGAVRKLAGHESIGIADLGEDATEGVLLLGRMGAPVLGIGPKLTGLNAA